MRRADHSLDKNSKIIAGVIADTHVPDRIDALHPDLEEVLRSAQVDVILHAGDISNPAVLRQLEKIAPVIAVRGNRDWAFRKTLPWSQTIVLGGVRILLTHGQGDLGNYLVDKVWYLLDGYRAERYLHLIERNLEDERVAIFGHTHRALVLERNGRLFFNPGSASFAVERDGQPSIGLLTIEDGSVQGRIVALPKIKIRGRKWRIF
jgi:putative phosphoesterase